MTNALERRLHKLEETLLPKPRQAVCILGEPARDATAEKWVEYGQHVDEAAVRGDVVIVVLPMKPADGSRAEKGVTYCRTEFEAQLLKASMLPSERGDKSLLDEVIRGAMGNTIGPVACDRSSVVLHS